MANKRSSMIAASFLTLAYCIITTTSAAAQDTAEAAGSDDGFGTIVVTAQRKAENIQRVPVAVTVLEPAVFENRGSFDPVDLGRVSTGVFANTFNGDRSNVIYTIRGQAMTTGTLFPAVVPYFAEVPLNKLFVGTFFDLENVQTLRGPQGTLFGRVTDGGNVLITPARPVDRLEAEIQGKVGNYNLRALNGMLNVPIVDGKLAVRGAFEINRRDGFTENLTDGRKLDGVHYESFRFSVRATPSEGFENNLIVNYTHANENGGSAQIYFVNRPAVIATAQGIFGAAGANAIANNLEAALATQQRIGPRKTYNNVKAFDRRKQLVMVNKTDIDLTSDIKARAVLGYIYLRQHTGNDYDGTNLNYIDSINSVLPATASYQRQLSGEFQVQGKVLNDALDFTVGTYFDNQRTPGPAEILGVSLSFLVRAAVQRVKTTSSAVYGQATYDLAPLVEGLKITGGVRYTSDTVFARSATWSALLTTTPDPIPHGLCLTTRPVGVLASSMPCVVNSAKFDKVTWNAGLEFAATDDLFMYGKISKGYRPGGFNLNAVTPSYGPESVISHEIGFKSDWSILGRPLRVNVAGFYDNFSNVQRLVTLADANGAASSNVNTKSATVKGIEAEVSLKPFNALELGVHYTYLKAAYNLDEYDAAYIAAACPADPRTMRADTSKFCPLSPFARTPTNTVAFNARYTGAIGETKISFGGDWYFTDSQYVVTTGYLTPEVQTPAYNVLNLDFTLSNIGGSPVDITVFGTNVTNRTYVSTVSSVSQMGSLGIAQYGFGAPRMYGVSMRYRFGG
ncbi:MAG: TonB-dependent receptor [Sphingobium sp.]